MAKRNFEWKFFPNLRSAKDLKAYLEEQKFQHGQYCHYTSLRSLDSILGNKEFWISNVSYFNDCIDSNQFCETDKQLCFALCFATGKHENLPLWYLYSGMSGKGARVRFTKVSVRTQITTGRYFLRRIKRSETGGWEIDSSFDAIELEEGKNMEKIWGDIVYYSNKNRDNPSLCVDLKYNTMTHHSFPANEFTDFQQNNIGFCKGLIWYYEKETRLLVRLTNEAAETVLNDKIDGHETRYVVVLEFNGKVYKGLKITLAPEADNIEEAINNHAAVRQFYTSHPKQMELSEHHGTLHMKACDRCEYKKELTHV